MIAQRSITSIEIPYVHCAPYRRRRESSKSKVGRSRVDVAQLKDTTSNFYLKDLRGHVRVSGGT